MREAGYQGAVAVVLHEHLAAVGVGNQVGRRLRRDRADRKRGAEAKRRAPCISAPAEWHYRDARNVPERGWS